MNFKYFVEENLYQPINAFYDRLEKIDILHCLKSWANIMTTKYCYGCKKTLDIKLFSESSCSIDGLMSKCETCREKANMSHYKNSVKQKKNYCIICAENWKFKRASYGLLTDMKMTHCTEHKTEEMVDLRNRSKGCIVCKENGKFKRASYGLLLNKKKTHCTENKTAEMVDLVNLKNGCIVCKDNGKFKQASFGILKDKKKTHCTEHKTAEMVDLVNLKNGCIVCRENGKFKNASYGLLKDNKRTHCTEHKTEEMVDLVDIKRGCIVCRENGKFKNACFGLLTDMKKTNCTEHKTEEMVDLVHIKNGCIVCKENEKFKRASYGLLSDNKKTHCTEHKTDDMIDLVDINRGCIVCKETGKFKNASYGLLKDMKQTHCTEHKTDDMINLADINRGCIVCKENGNFKRASFGKLFEKKLHCKVHAMPNEYSKNNPKCEKCFEQPLYGDEKLSLIPERCETHKKSTDIDLVSRECEGCHDTYFIPSTQTKCKGCLGIDLRKKSNRGVKEGKVADCLMQLSKIMGEPAPIRDKRILHGCSAKRPDFYYPEFSDHFSLIVEVDEGQHSSKTCGIQGEIIRMINLFEEQEFTGFPLIFIRFNPDPYYYNNKEVKAYRGREDKLQQVVKGLKNRTEMDCYIGVIYLFYDEFEKVKIEPLKYEMKKRQLFVEHHHPLDQEFEREYVL